MELNLKGKTALITGGSKGIGAATARRLASEGCNLVLVARSRPDLERIASELSSPSVRVDIFPADLSKSEQIDAVANTFPNIDILVNNAGAIESGDLLSLSEEQWRAGWDLKVFGYINMCRAFYRHMKSRSSGVIVNVIGAAARGKSPQYICGVAANAALEAFTQSIGSKSHEDGIRVIGIHPGPIATERLLKLGAQNLPRVGQPEDIASAIAFLASGHSAFTSGIILTIDGGLTARAP